MSIIPDSIDGVLAYAASHIPVWNAVVTAGGIDGADGLTPAQITALQTALTTAQTDRNSAISARNTSLAATQTQNDSVSALHDLLALAIADIKAYANQQADPNAVYTEMEVPVPASTGTRYSPVPVTDLIATPDTLGDVELKWNGGANAVDTVYFIEGSADGTAWTQVFATKRQRISLSGYTPGQTYWFRVKASNNGEVSSASSSVAIWGGGGSANLSIAA